MKIIDLCQKKCDVPDVRDELLFLNRLDHTQCLKLYAFHVDISLTVTMLVEFCPYSVEDLRVAKDSKESIRTRIELNPAREIMFQAFQGIKYLHQLSDTEAIGHFDIKPDNLMCTPAGTIKIADFGQPITRYAPTWRNIWI